MPKGIGYKSKKKVKRKVKSGARKVVEAATSMSAIPFASMGAKVGKAVKRKKVKRKKQKMPTKRMSPNI